jgi:hypothetical protein
MKKNWLNLGILVLCFVPLLAAQKQDVVSAGGVVDICSVAVNSKAFDTKEIVVDAIYRIVIHGAVLTGRNCPELVVAGKEVDAYKADKQAAKEMQHLLKKDKFVPVEVVVRGTFHVAHQGQCFGGENCARYLLEISELISAKAVSAGSSTNTLLHESGHVDPPKPQ